MKRYLSRSHRFHSSLSLCLAAVLQASSLPAGAVTGAEYRRLADLAAASHLYNQAAKYYRLEADVYRKNGDPEAANVEEMKAARWGTDVVAYVEGPPDRQSLLGNYTGGKFEPIYGCYLSAYVAGDRDLDGGEYSEGNVEYARKAATLGNIIHKHIASSWDYLEYGDRFPTNWARTLLEDGTAPHIAWEPNAGLGVVKDDQYLEDFARAAAAVHGPVFLRFACEMNGNWTAYHDNPAEYRAKFRLVHEVMADLAPNVAMIWCVNATPAENMDEYYPGDDAVDWVGVNFYSVLHHNNDMNAPAWFENPASLLEAVYHKYAARKPIAICEYGASHREKINETVDRSDIAATKIAELLAALPRQFPRVKMIGFFDCNNLIANVRAGRQLNDYCITDNAQVLSTFARLAESDYFLPQVITTASEQSELPQQIRPLTAGTTLSGAVQLSAWVRTYDDNHSVWYSIDGRRITRVSAPGEYRCELDTATLTPGRHVLALDVYDSAGQKAGSREIPVLISRAGSHLPANVLETAVPSSVCFPDGTKMAALAPKGP